MTSKPTIPPSLATTSASRPARPRLDIPRDRLAQFCRKWGVAELSLFGSVLREDFSSDSDVDVLVTLAPDSPGITFENRPQILDELSELFGGRRVDLVEKNLIRNPFRRHSILTTAKVVYAA